MKKYFVSYEQSLDLKEIGYVDYSWFGSECSLYKPNGKHTFYMNGIGDETYISAPLKSQVFDWFREKHKLCGVPQYFTGGFYCYSINDMKDQKESNRLFTEFETYEEAESACIDTIIEIIKNE